MQTCKLFMTPDTGSNTKQKKTFSCIVNYIQIFLSTDEIQHATSLLLTVTGKQNIANDNLPNF